jgi:hypothetical protein
MMIENFGAGDVLVVIPLVEFHDLWQDMAPANRSVSQCASIVRVVVFA